MQIAICNLREQAAFASMRFTPYSHVRNQNIDVLKEIASNFPVRVEGFFENGVIRYSNLCMRKKCLKIELLHFMASINNNVNS